MLAIPTLILLAPAAIQTPTTVEVTDQVLRPDITRFGVNLGHNTGWEASQLMANLIENPGFEDGYYSMVSHAAFGTTGDTWLQDYWRPSWNSDTFGVGQPLDFWNGATWEIIDGPSVGRTGVVLDYTHDNDRGTMLLDSTGPTPVAGDIMFLRKPIAEQPDHGYLAAIETGDARPGSAGVQCLRLSVDPNQLWRASRSWYFDTFWSNTDLSAGKLQLADGNWDFKVWAKGEVGGETLRIKLFRSGEGNFIDETFVLTDQWQLIERSYVIPEGTDDPRVYTEQESHPNLTFNMTLGGAGQEVLIDDLVLERAHQNAFGFLDETVDALQELRPGVLRSWAGFFGGDLATTLADPFASGYIGFSPAKRVPNLWNYRLHDFLGLCQTIDAEPWYVIPVTWTEADLQGLIEYLSGPADGLHPWADLRAARGQVAPWTDVFDTIHLEFSNEGWGAGTSADPFFGASLIGGVTLGEVAHVRLNMLKASPDFDAADYDLIIGGQHSYSGRQNEIEANSSAHDAIGVAPYFFRILDEFATDEDIFHRLFAVPVAEAAANGRLTQSVNNLANFGQGTALHAYEINFHLNRQDALNPAPIELRNDVVSGLGGGLAMPLTMLTYLRDLDMRIQLAFTFTGFSSETDDGERIRSWGLVRDLLRTGRKRPTFLGMSLTNMAMRGDMIETVQSGADPIVSVSPGNWMPSTVDLHLVQSFAFQEGDRRILVLFNLDLDNVQPVIIDTSGPVTSRAQGGGLMATSIYSNNEDSEDVSLEFRGLPGFSDGTRIGLPPASMVVITWRQ